MLLPLFASGHGLELMQARMDWNADGSLRLEMTADYGGNPMLNSESEAREALLDLLRVEFDGREHKLAELSPLSLDPRSQFDPTSPMPLPPEAAGTTHQLLTALWHWRPATRELRFSVPKGCIHDVLFWKHDPHASPLWCVLITGDKTPVITVPAPSRPPLLIVTVCAAVLLLCLAVWGGVRRRLKSACAPASALPSSPP